MSQEAVFKILQELGGTATARQISALALKKFPDYTLHNYVYDRLKRLEKWGKVTFDGKQWIIVKRKTSTKKTKCS